MLDKWTTAIETMSFSLFGYISNKMKLQRYFAFLFLIFFLISSQVTADSALYLFERQFNIWKSDKQQKLSSSLSPWKPYLNRSFDEGLSQQDKKRYLSYQESGDCYSVIQLDLLGFLTLYPFLTPAFERIAIRDYFERNIAYQYSKGANRCFAKETLNKIISASEINNNIFPKIFLPVKNENILRNPDYKMTLPERKVVRAFMIIYVQAFCQKHIPSINDINLYLKNKYISLSLVDRNFIFEHLISVKIDGPRKGKTLNEVSPQAFWCRKNKK